jgi:DNA mismatch repair protein MutL
MDPHAAHERILYDRIVSTQGDSQSLLVPYLLDAHDNEQFLEEARDKLEFVGYRIVREKEAQMVESVPSLAAEGALEALVEWMSMPHSGGSPLDSIAAQLACKAAIKDGETLDPNTAQKLIEEALELREPRCPHGRPIFLSVSKERLYSMFGRLVG